jgi:hypothetical protein
MSYFHRHIDLCRLVDYFAHCTIVSLSQLILQFKLIHTDAKRGTAGEIHSLCMENGFAIEIQSAGWIA